MKIIKTFTNEDLEKVFEGIASDIADADKLWCYGHFHDSFHCQVDWVIDEVRKRLGDLGGNSIDVLPFMCPWCAGQGCGVCCGNGEIHITKVEANKLCLEARGGTRDGS